MQRISCFSKRRNNPSVTYFIYRDLKPANIFRRGKEFKIGDFGFSKQLNFH